MPHLCVSAELIDYVGADVAAGLLRWTDITGHQVHKPAESYSWIARGYTDAFVVSLIVTPSHGKPSYLVAKVVPAEERREGATHSAAWHEAPESFRRDHMVRLRFDGVPTETGRVVLFQDLAGGTRRCQPVSRVCRTELAECCGVAAASLLTEWNTDGSYQPYRTSAEHFLQGELYEPHSGASSVDSWTAERGLAKPSVTWITTPDDPAPLPNPVAMVTGHHPATRDHEINVLRGRGHGDLHLDNLLVHQDDHGARPTTFRLIDLSTYDSAMPLVRDQISLLLSAVTMFLPVLGPGQATHLLTDLTRVDIKPNVEQNPLLVAVIEQIRAAGQREIGPTGFLDSWYAQCQLAILSAALRFTSFTNLGASARWWFFRLAAHAGAAYLRVEKLGEPSGEPLLITSPFIDVPTNPPVSSLPPQPLTLRGMIVGGRQAGPIGADDASLDHG